MSVTATSNTAATLAPANDARQTFSDLVSAIRSGDLDAAQSAYADFSQSAAGQTGPLAQVAGQIGAALQSGDIGQAQQALASLAKGAHHHGGHHHGGETTQAAAPATTSADSGATPAASAVDVTA
jgi:hypothetical protein